MPDTTKMTSAELIEYCGGDAMKWAEAFCQHNPDANIEVEHMMAWFTNAIEHSHDLRLRHMRQQEQLMMKRHNA